MFRRNVWICFLTLTVVIEFHASLVSAQGTASQPSTATTPAPTVPNLPQLAAFPGLQQLLMLQAMYSFPPIPSYPVLAALLGSGSNPWLQFWMYRMMSPFGWGGWGGDDGYELFDD